MAHQALRITSQIKVNVFSVQVDLGSTYDLVHVVYPTVAVIRTTQHMVAIAEIKQT